MLYSITTCHAANKELLLLWKTLSSAKPQQYYALNGITWNFIILRMAWWGGCWVRQCPLKVLGGALVDEESRFTVLIGKEAALKSRPLVYDDNSAALTPTHFLTG
ncbi:integrase catalytic domain-containing protein [Trichonephila clavipes]|nr:integrase catalytic domain-containing protein [Trichonephila clavipes]